MAELKTTGPTIKESTTDLPKKTGKKGHRPPPKSEAPKTSPGKRSNLSKGIVSLTATIKKQEYKIQNLLKKNKELELLIARLSEENDQLKKK